MMTEANHKLPWVPKIIVMFLSVVLMIAVIGTILYFVALKLEAIGYMPIIQQALDEQCGEGTFVADPEGYSGDPNPSWGNSEAICDLNHNTDEFICSCEGVP